MVVYIFLFTINASDPSDYLRLLQYCLVHPVHLLDFYYRHLTTVCSYPTDEQLKSLNEKNRQLEDAQDRNASIQVLEEVGSKTLAYLMPVKNTLKFQAGLCRYQHNFVLMYTSRWTCVQENCMCFSCWFIWVEVYVLAIEITGERLSKQMFFFILNRFVSSRLKPVPKWL